MGKKISKHTSLLMAVFFMLTSIVLPTVNVYAEETNDPTETVVLEEGFTGDNDKTKPIKEGWVLIKDGKEVSDFGGYSSSGLFGKEIPSIAFGKRMKEGVLESPEFKLEANGKLSFWYRGNGGDVPVTSILKVEYKVGEQWSKMPSLKIGDAVKDGKTYVANLPKEASKVRFCYKKNNGNIGIDDIVISYGGDPVPEEPVEPDEPEEPSKPSEGCITIAEARAVKNEEVVSVEGVVTYIDQNRTGQIQDSTGGIAVHDYNKGFANIKTGQKIKVTGKKAEYKGLAQVVINSVEKDVQVISETGMPKAKKVTIAELNLKTDYDSQYVLISDAIIDRTNHKLTQGSDSISLQYGKDADKSNLDTVKDGDVVTVKATVGRFDKAQLYGPSCTFEVSKSDDKVPPVIEHEAVKKAFIAEDLIISAKITDDVAVKGASIFFRVKGVEKYTSIAMKKGNDDIYSATISKDMLKVEGLEYYVQANDGANVVKSPNENFYSVEVSDEDNKGPEIYNLVPNKGASVGEERTPQISAELKDQTGIKKDSIKLYVDNKDVTSKATISEEKIEYKVAEDLIDGNHTVKVEVEDTLGHKSSMEWNFRVGKVSHLFGQLHAHTNISDGAGSLDEAYTHVKEAGADYYAVTDHSNWFDNEIAGNIADGSASTKWVDAHKTADKYNKENEFTAIYGYEMTWSKSTGYWGHINTFNTPGFETRTNKEMDLPKYYETIQTQPQSVSQLNHPGKTFGDFADFGYYTAGADKVVNLVEVGNGEGPIRGSGYFPSYEYYTRALDKGWHVAPTNNQDNHKGNWYTSNNARTVILSPENTREGIYDAIRNKSIYASEDTDMVVDYTVNGQMMGSCIDKDGKNLSFNVKAHDDEPIAKISIIANGGVEVASKNFDTKDVDWSIELKPEYTYYYAKVAQKDQDIAVTAPVWVGKSEGIGLNNVTVNKTLVVPDEEVEISVEAFNNEEFDLNDVKVEFFENKIEDSKKIGEVKVPIVASGKTEKVLTKWTPKKKGNHTIHAKATVDLNGVKREYTSKIDVKVTSPDLVQKVVIDGAHQNQYVSGNYANSYNAFQRLLEGRSTQVVLNKEPITDKTFEGAGLFILTCPQSTKYDKYNLTPDKLEQSEIEAIKRYVDKGGNLIVTTIADYRDGEGEYSNDKQLNPILEAVGTELRINDDQVIDATEFSNQQFRLYLTRYSTDNKYGLVNGVEEGKDQYSFYSGSSVILAEGTKGEDVDFIVKGHKTTTTQDADNKGDNVPVKMGEVNVLGAEQLKGGGKVVVGGNTFFSDFEIDGTSGDSYSNKKVVKNVMDWMVPQKESPVTKIADVRVDANKDGIPDLMEEEFTIEGTVTSQSEAVQPKNSFFEVIYVEDETGGICVFGVSKTPLKVGQKVRITGSVDAYDGEFELEIKDEDSELKIIDENINPIEAAKVTTGDSMLAVNGGKLVKVEGKVVNMDDTNIYIDDGSGVSRVYVQGYIWDGINEDMKGKWDANIKVGDNVSAIGIGSYDPEGARLRVRNTGEIVLVEAGKVEEPTDNKPENPADNNKPVDNNKPADSKQESSTDLNNTSKKDEVSNKTNSTKKENKVSLPKTGGSNKNIIISVIAIIIIVGGATVLLKKKKQEN